MSIAIEEEPLFFFRSGARLRRICCRSREQPSPIPGNGFAEMPGSAIALPSEPWFSAVDGLGHGWEASEAAQEAVATFHKRVECRPAEILLYVHEALRKTRGAVAAIAEIRPRDGTLTYAGVGNISAVVLNGGVSRSLVSHNGTLGATISRIQAFQTDWPKNAVLVMHSDGLQSRWDLAAYTGLLARDPAVIGAALLRDFRRHRDDASVVVVKGA